MKRTLSLAAAVFAAVAFLAWWALRDAGTSGGRDAAAQAPLASAAAGRDIEPTTRPAGSAPRRPAVAAIADDDAGVESYDPEARIFGVTVRVLRSDGSPAAGAVVTTVVGERAAMEPTEKTADEAGRVSFDDLELSGSRWFLATWSGREAVLARRPEQPIEVEMRLAPATTVEGRVETTRGEPVEDARCDLTWPEEAGVDLPTTLTTTQSDASGRFRFPTLPDVAGAAPSVTASIREEGWDADTKEVRSGTAILLLRPPRRASGRCVDGQRRPVAGAKVAAFGLTAATDSEGWFTLERIPTAPSYLVVDAQGFAPALAEIAEGRDDAGVGDLVLAEGQPISGVLVLESDRTPVPGARAMVTAWTEDHQSALWCRETQTGPDGKFTIEHVDAGRDVELRCHLTLAVWSERVTVRAPARDVEMELPPGGLLRLRFVGADGTTAIEVPSVTVSCLKWDLRAACPRPSSELVVAGAPGTAAGVRIKARGWKPVTLSELTLLPDAAVTQEIRLREREDPPDAPGGGRR